MSVLSAHDWYFEKSLPHSGSQIIVLVMKQTTTIFISVAYLKSPSQVRFPKHMQVEKVMNSFS